MHPSEIARLRHAEGWDADRLTPAVAPGSSQEAHALALIDAARVEELGERARSFDQRQSAARRYWRRHARDV